MVNLDYLYKPELAKPIVGRNCFIDKKLGFQVIEHGTILPYKKMVDGKKNKNNWGFGGVVDGEGRFIPGTHVLSRTVGSYTPPPPRVNYTQLTNRRLSRNVSQYVGARYYG